MVMVSCNGGFLKDVPLGFSPLRIATKVEVSLQGRGKALSLREDGSGRELVVRCFHYRYDFHAGNVLRING
jgi:hypothetical protein